MVYKNYILDELADFIADMDTAKVLAFKFSEQSQQQLNALLTKKKASVKFTNEEEKELEQILLLDHIMSLAKARVLKKMAQKGNR